MKGLENFNKVEKVETANGGFEGESKFEKPDVNFKANNFETSNNLDNVKETDNPEDWQKGTPLDGANGTWEAERGNSEWRPDPDVVPQNSLFNPEQKTYGEIFDSYPEKGVQFDKGEAMFEPFAEATVKINNFSENRYLKGGNFDQATEKFAEQKGISSTEAKEYIRDNRLTWHERSDCKTMDLVPTELHGNVRHSGGISAFKHQNGLEDY